jgi:hypothetical protein
MKPSTLPVRHTHTHTHPDRDVCTVPSLPQVTIGDDVCDVLSWSNFEIVCLAPPGVGANPPLVVTVDGQSNAVTTGLVGYYPPALSGFVFPANGDSSGGSIVTFTGTNLGPTTSLLVVSMGFFPCVVAVHTHTLGVCVVSAGAGRGLPVTVSRGPLVPGVPLDVGTATTSLVAEFSYDPPVITGITPVDPSAGYPTSGGFSVRSWAGGGGSLWGGGVRRV